MPTMNDYGTAETISEAEALSLGIGAGPIHAGEFSDPDNPLVESFLSDRGLPQTDKEGRPIISYRQYVELGNMSARMDGYAMLVARVDKAGRWPIQASKYLKWYGLDYCHPDDKEGWNRLLKMYGMLKPQRRGPAPQVGAHPTTAPTPAARTVYECSEKYPDCSRFFDTAEGLKFHWRKDHEGMVVAKRRRPSVVAPAAAEE